MDTHLIADLWECPAERLADERGIREAMVEAARRAGATVVDTTFHRFAGGGVTGVVAVKESHLTIHTWPERGYAAVDVFLCGRANPRVALRHLAKTLGARRRTVQEHERGSDPAPGVRRGRIRWSKPSTPMLFLYGITLVVAMCSLVYELLLAQTLSALLGNTILRYSITIGAYLGALGVGAMLCGPEPTRAPERLLRIEIALSALGGVAVPLFYFLDVLQRYFYMAVSFGSVWETIIPLLYLLATHAVIVGIGLLSGFEVPLLLALGERLEEGSTNKVLGVDYFGALIGSVLFPLVFLRSFGLMATGFAIALANALAALVLMAWRPEARRLRAGAGAVAVAVALVAFLASSYRVEQYFLKKFYYSGDVTGLASLFDMQDDRPDIERHRSPYQTIDLVLDDLDSQWVYDKITTRRASQPGYPRDLWLYLNRDYQLHSGSDEFYHEWFVHAPVQANERAPTRVLVLGGGDGLAIREVLKYDTVERVVHVELDPFMLDLAAHHPLLSAMNGRPDKNPRVTTIQADAFQWLRSSRALFDAVYIDMPAVRNYDLSLVYSREFYGLVREHLEPYGFVAIDTPSGSCEFSYSLWDRYYSTLRAAGFETVVPMVARVNLDAPRVTAVVNALAHDSTLEMPVAGDTTIQLTEDQRQVYFRSTVAQSLAGGEDEFTVAFPVRRSINTVWRDDLAVPLDALGPAHLAAAFPGNCPTYYDAAKVNSVARPTLPTLELLSVRLN